MPALRAYRAWHLRGSVVRWLEVERLPMNSYTLQPVGLIRSTLKQREEAPRQRPEGAPDAWLEIEPQFTEALLGMEVGHELIVIRWLHEAKRDVLKNHLRSDESRPLTGVFTRVHRRGGTRSGCIR